MTRIFIFVLHLLLLLHLLSIFAPSEGALISGFHPYGIKARDKILTEERKNLSISTRIIVYGDAYAKLEVTKNFTVNFNSFPQIYPFYDTYIAANQKNISWRLTRHPPLLTLLKKEVKIAFPKISALRDFRPYWAFIFTQESSSSSCQIALFWNNKNTFVCLYFVEYNGDAYVFDYKIPTDACFETTCSASWFRKFCFRIDTLQANPPTNQTTHPFYTSIPKFYSFARAERSRAIAAGGRFVVALGGGGGGGREEMVRIGGIVIPASTTLVSGQIVDKYGNLEFGKFNVGSSYSFDTFRSSYSRYSANNLDSIRALYYVVTNSSSVLTRAKNDVTKAFPNINEVKQFIPSRALVITWYDLDITYYTGGFHTYCNIQAVMFWNSNLTFVCFIYDNMDLYGVSAIIGDYETTAYFELSNMDVPGQSCFRIDSYQVYIPTKNNSFLETSYIPTFLPFGSWQNYTKTQEETVQFSISPLVLNIRQNFAKIGTYGLITLGPHTRIAPFYTESKGAKTYYNLLKDQTTLDLIHNEYLKKAFPNVIEIKSFKPQMALIVTWYETYLLCNYIYSSGSTMSVQLVLFWNSNYTFVCFNYYGYYNSRDCLITSFIGGTQLSLNSEMTWRSNFGVQGKYCFRIDGDYVQMSTNSTKFVPPILETGFYPFGPNWGDDEFYDTIGPIVLPSPISILSRNQSEVTISINGTVIFNNGVNIIPIQSYGLSGGRWYYSINKNEFTLDMANKDIKNAFPSLTFNASWTFIVTWYLVPFGMDYTIGTTNYLGSGQLVIISGNGMTFACFVYSKESNYYASEVCFCPTIYDEIAKSSTPIDKDYPDPYIKICVRIDKTIQYL